jgi:hypothetical protein
MKAHYYSNKHIKKNTIACAECGKLFKGPSLGGMHYHRCAV